MTHYLVYRHGSNAANQSMTPKMAVAIVEARSQDDAIARVRTRHPSLVTGYRDDMTVLPYVSCYANQSFSAVPRSRANKDDWMQVVEDSAQADMMFDEASR